MKKNLISLLLATALIISVPLTFAGCNETEGNTSGTTDAESTETTEKGNDQTTDAESDSDSGTETSAETGTESTSNSEQDSTEETETDTVEDKEVYADGGKVKNAGYSWDDDAFALENHKIKESAAQNITAAELKEKLRSKELTGKEVFNVTDLLTLDSNTKYYGNGAAIIASAGIQIKDAEEIVIKELIIKGNIVLENADGITFFKVDVQDSGTAVSIDAQSYDIAFKSCKVSSSGENGVGVSSNASLISFFESYVSASTALSLNGDEIAIQDCHIVAVELGIKAAGDDIIIKNNIVEANTDGTGISLVKGASNALVALNIVKTAQKSISVTEGFNCVVLLNSAIRVIGENSTNIYVVSNNLGGRINLHNNNYMLCDANTHVKDNMDHTVISLGNENFNGDNVTNVNERAEVGAKEDLLPHTNKDLFVGMKKKVKVKDISNVKTYDLNNYIRNQAKDNTVVIVPPGYYTSSSPISIAVAHANTTVYAYGVYEEYTSDGTLLSIESTSNITINGLTMGYSMASSGQIHVIEKLGNNTVRVVAGAGFIDGFYGVSEDPDTFGNTNYYFPDGRMDAELRGVPFTLTRDTENPDTMILKYTGDKASKRYYDTAIGDVFTCRLGGNNKTSIYIGNAKNVNIRDSVFYGYSAALAVVSAGTSENVSFERWHNTAKSNLAIDKATYEKYDAIQKQYNVDLDVHIDDNGNYRGSIPRSGSVDGTHINGAKEGVNVTSSIFEYMVDDSSNQRGSSSRLHNYVKNEDGTTTLYYKNNLSTYYYNAGNTTGGSCSSFKAGDRIFMYNSKGATVCDTTVLDNAVYYNRVTDNFENKYGVMTTYTANVYVVHVKTEDIDFSALEDYTFPSDNGYNIETKVLVDNLSQNSVGFTFDNVLMQSYHSRGILMKTCDSNVKYCTFRDVGLTGVLMSTENATWGESTVPRNIKIQYCLFDHVGYHQQDYTSTTYAAISMSDRSTELGDDRLPIDNILIEGCKFMNNQNRYAIYVNSARNVKIINNTFEPIVGESARNPGIAIMIDMAMNIEISGNTFNYIWSDDITDLIVTKNCKNIFGDNTVDGSGNTLFPDKLPVAKKED